ncbi:MAG: bifunctional tRNA (5-methylaminomethyl-2-thiouridine)(34)-methyltransferase MnmD/FAD-dependent 5-carboxymethylaminomethyl-2-thiouridine(34) oxidoreductase MnmC [Halieaceae bacterium]|nr:bifunctional tRNA (5-methylaminomethyl-2-thiouridine)(34)-methyltransferase MnmD/FAD-dependent 5-carboxymethylaminomethyl-2-thiouridine(34) oxidoreductase MnmC [Halieaceae bacterium]
MSTERRWQALPAAKLVWSGNIPRSVDFDDIYFSRESGLEEARHVFLRGNHLPEAWLGRSHFSICETGFGTGLNFLATWLAWLDDPRRCTHLHYLAIEKFPLPAPDCGRAFGQWNCLSSLGEQLLAQYPHALPGRHRLLFEKGRLVLDLVYADAAEALQSLQEEPEQSIDCWFLDGFSPARNPEMWTSELFQSMAALSSPRASFATFSTAGQVRRGLRDAHFSISKAPGYGNKREMLSGRYDGSTETRSVAPTQTRRKGAQRWHLGPPSHRRIRQADRPVAAILGAGLAGAATAEALARRDWQVTVLERERVAAAASGNLQGVLYTRLSNRDSPLNSFTVHSYGYALRYYRRLAAAGSWQPGRDGEFCGVLQLLEHPEVDPELARVVAGLPNLVRSLGAAEAAAISGLKRCPGGLFYPEGGWLHPPAICRAMLQHPRITLLEDCGTVRVARAGTGWRLFDQQGTLLHQTPTLVIASGHEASQWAETRWLPLQKIRGQVTHLPSRGELRQLRTVICHSGFVAPARSRIHCIGASFDLGDEDPHLRTDSHQANLEKLQTALDLEYLDHADAVNLPGRVGFRCTSPDYLPIVGPAPDFNAVRQDFAFLRQNARQTSEQYGTMLPGLYLNTAHGARGLTSTPLAAELLAAQITGAAAPLDTALQQALSPTRFIIRGLKRRRL